jgi:hypothetical protein
MIYTKGSVLLGTLDFITREVGGEALNQVLEALNIETRQAIQRAAATDEIPLSLAFALWNAADGVLSPQHPEWMERAGAHSIDFMGVQLYSGIVRKPSPLAFLNQRISLFRLFYRPGDMEVVEQETGRAVLRLVGFDASDRLFCRRQTGGLRRVLEIAGGGEPTARHVRCALDGDAFCEWDLRWDQ